MTRTRRVLGQGMRKRMCLGGVSNEEKDLPGLEMRRRTCQGWL